MVSIKCLVLCMCSVSGAIVKEVGTAISSNQLIHAQFSDTPELRQPIFSEVRRVDQTPRFHVY